MDLNRKYWYIDGGHLTNFPLSTNYVRVIRIDSVCIALFIADLTGLEILAGDIQNAYLNAITKEKVFHTLDMN